MEELISYQNNLLKSIDNKWHRYLFALLKTDERLLGLKGLRGVGKTTMLLQFLKYAYKNRNGGLYVTADHPYFYQNTLFGLAEEWNNLGGKLLLIDEVHKYENWSRELKLIYDGFPELQIIFTSSSALDLYKGESDLSRRLVTQTLEGMSFREYLSLKHNINFEPIPLTDILTKHNEIAQELVSLFKPIPLFKSYLKEGYFPFIKGIRQEGYLPRVLKTINTVIESDLVYIQDYSASNSEKIKKLLGVIASSAPFEPNISKIAQRLQLGRNTVNNYLQHLQDAKIVTFLHKNPKGISRLQKPNKIYFDNSSLVYAIQFSAEIGTIRETFFINQIRNAGHQIILGKKGDFLVNDKHTFEIGGKNKDITQIKGIPNSYLALDDIEYGFNKKIPLWLFGFMY